MANKVTGKTDTTGALTTAPIAPKSLIIVGTAGESQSANKAEKSMSYLVQHTKDLILACGKNVDLSAEKDMEWVEKSLNALKESKAEFKFHQGEGPKGLEITFIDAQENPTDF